jgi:hypothetical protein
VAGARKIEGLYGCGIWKKAMTRVTTKSVAMNGFRSMPNRLYVPVPPEYE